jgi:hypothetical protein
MERKAKNMNASFQQYYASLNSKGEKKHGYIVYSKAIKTPM